MPIKGRSFTLIEVMIAVFLLTTGMLGSFALIQKTIAFTSDNSFQLRAIYLAQEGIEVVRNIRDNNWLAERTYPDEVNWDTGLGAGTKYLDWRLSNNNTSNLVIWDYGATGKYYLHYNENSCKSYPNQCKDTLFTRRIEISYPETNIMRVKSIVEWSERGNSRQVAAETELYNWRY